MPLLSVEAKRVGNPRGTPEQLLHDPQARRRRREEKLSAVLRFLREEIYTTSTILGRVMGVAGRPAVQKYLEKMERCGFLKCAEISTEVGRRLLWGITGEGQSMAFDPGKNEDPITKVFEPSTVTAARLRHTLTLQTMKLDCLERQWTGWRNCDRGKQAKPKAGKLKHRADAIAISPAGHVVAIELELTFKSIPRYVRDVLPSHLRQMAVDRRYQYVVWVCPEPEGVRRMRSLIERAVEQTDKETQERLGTCRKEAGGRELLRVASLVDWTDGWDGKTEDRARNLGRFMWQRFWDATQGGTDLEAEANELEQWLPEDDYALVRQTLKTYRARLAEDRQRREAEHRREQEERDRQAREASARYEAEMAAREEAERRANSLTGKLGKLLGK